jgi:uncharacterized membrane protein
MMFGVLSRLVRVRVTVTYAVVLVLVTTTLTKLGPDVQARVIEHASTNLHNLSHGHVGTLLGSAVVVDAGPIYEWLPGLICLLGVGELAWRSWRLLVAFAVGLTTAVRFGWLPGAVTSATDVGMSYGATSVLGALTPAIPRRLRPTWIGWWLAVGATVTAGATDFTDVGHLVALILGMAVATRFGSPRRWTSTRVALLALGGVFGYLILVNGQGSVVPATVAGLAGALLATLACAPRLWAVANPAASRRRRVESDGREPT